MRLIHKGNDLLATHRNRDCRIDHGQSHTFCSGGLDRCSYREASLRELFAALNQRAGDLLSGDKPVGQRDTAYLLLRRIFKWAGPHLGLAHNPTKGIEQARERKRRRLPSPEVYAAVVDYARTRGALIAHSKGSQPRYLWMVAELSYLCRLRGIETVTLVEAQGEAEGVRTDRRKGSRNNIVEWAPRLRAAWDAALAHRAGVIERRRQPLQLRADARFLFLSEDGEPLTKDGLDSAWQRLIKAAIRDGVITEEQRFSLHDLKRKGGTDTAGNVADKQTALGVSPAMMKVYDLSVPLVRPSGEFGFVQ